MNSTRTIRGAKRTARAIALVMGAVALTANIASAQSGTAKNGSTSQCRMPDTTQAWFKQQRELLADTAHSWANDTLRTQLLRAAGFSADLRRIPPQMGWQLYETSVTSTPEAAEMMDRLRALAGQRGSIWPTQSVVGVVGARAAWILVQRDTTLLRTALHRMMEAGQDGNLPADIATTEDRLRLSRGRKQIHGTQLINTNGKLTIAPVEDSAHVDMRRDNAGLPPLAASLCAANRAQK